MYEELAILGIFTFCYSIVSGRVEKLPTSGPIVFVAVGLLLGPLGLGLFKNDVSRDQFRVLVDLTLALIPEPPAGGYYEGFVRLDAFGTTGLPLAFDVVTDETGNADIGGNVAQVDRHARSKRGHIVQ